ncbi:MAG TPA: hypothetical protein VMH02_12515 [Verrucomicrobiae bacterium]|nr:hypothetical protein [Verrucomicrobiae bacterium]
MVRRSGARASSDRCELMPGIAALPPGLLWIEATRTLVAADAHLAYEEAIGGALPLWSTGDALALLAAAIDRTDAQELVLLGDVVHSSRMSDGAAGAVRSALAALRERCTVTPIAGNHEGRTRGALLLGETADAVERDGWLLLHGDDPIAAGAAQRRIVGHLHPSLPLARGESTPCFLHAATLVVVPALTPYSSGLNALSPDCTRALHAFIASTEEVEVVAVTADRVYPFGSLGGLRNALQRRPTGAHRPG